MKPLVLQQVEISDLIEDVIKKAEDGGLYSSTARCFGNIEASNGRTYTLAIVATCDSDEFYRDTSLPLVQPEDVLAGKGVVRAPAELYPSGTPLDADQLNFPPEEE